MSANCPACSHSVHEHGKTGCGHELHPDTSFDEICPCSWSADDIQNKFVGMQITPNAVFHVRPDVSRDTLRALVYAAQAAERMICTCPADGHSEFCPLHKTKSSPR